MHSMHQEERLMNKLLMNEEDFNLLKSILQITDIRNAARAQILMIMGLELGLGIICT